ncbi:unnamed protein product [Dovyalis caffra]|uniref:Uncharacterized protein n=1 Tax=Dovyalis caffra TaxID=77055 RepID=A0AAV1S4A2_9ROSI|nr:unnamed protein product [Dovyalis caffra]
MEASLNVLRNPNRGGLTKASMVFLDAISPFLAFHNQWKMTINGCVILDYEERSGKYEIGGPTFLTSDEIVSLTDTWNKINSPETAPCIYEHRAMTRISLPVSCAFPHWFVVDRTREERWRSVVSMKSRMNNSYKTTTLMLWSACLDAKKLLVLFLDFGSPRTPHGQGGVCFSFVPNWIGLFGELKDSLTGLVLEVSFFRRNIGL